MIEQRYAYRSSLSLNQPFNWNERGRERDQRATELAFDWWITISVLCELRAKLTTRLKSICINRMNRCVDPSNNMCMVGYIRSYVAHILLSRKPLFFTMCVSCWSTECTSTLNPSLLLCIHSKIVIDSRRAYLMHVCNNEFILMATTFALRTFCLSVRSDCILSFLLFCPPFPPSLEIIAFTLCLSL